MLRYFSVCVCGALLMSSFGFAAPPAGSAPGTLALTITGNALAKTPITPDTPVQLSPRQATLHVRICGQAGSMWHLLHFNHRPVKYSIGLTGVTSPTNYRAVISRDGGHTWSEVPTPAFIGDGTQLSWQVTVRGPEQVIVEVQQKDTPHPSKWSSVEVELERMKSQLSSIDDHLRGLPPKIEQAMNTRLGPIEAQVRQINQSIETTTAEMRDRQSRIRDTFLHFLAATDSVQLSAKAVLNGGNVTGLRWIKHPASFRITGPQQVGIVALPRAPIAGSVIFRLDSTDHPNGAELIEVPIRFLLAGDELVGEMAFTQSIAAPLEAALLRQKCTLGRYMLRLELCLHEYDKEYRATCGNSVLLEIIK